jgi:NADP-reducing hydrogenase subunit HndB
MIRSLEDLNRFREQILEDKKRDANLGNVQVIVSLGSCGIAAGAFDTLKAVQHLIKTDQLSKMTVSQVGCVGLCKYEPIVEVIAPGSAKVTYGRVTPEVVQRILREHVIGGKVVEEFVIKT